MTTIAEQLAALVADPDERTKTTVRCHPDVLEWFRVRAATSRNPRRSANDLISDLMTAAYVAAHEHPADDTPAAAS